MDYLFVNEEELSGILSYDELIPAIPRAPTDLSAERVVQPLRTVMSVA
jgi:hypothetical protein